MGAWPAIDFQCLTRPVWQKSLIWIQIFSNHEYRAKKNTFFICYFLRFVVTRPFRHIKHDHDLWHVTCDIWNVPNGLGWTFYQNLNSLIVWDLTCLKDKEKKDKSVSELPKNAVFFWNAPKTGQILPSPHPLTPQVLSNSWDTCILNNFFCCNF